ncbi:excinuclease ABC subunit C [Vibrio lentus]|uniref:GIY-YIG nuclease family protein n=1 Tax=Vibrio lentus TaxID=136468 RepID=UPI000C84988E|nr:GIY-YIG nuclease family protein [Vibrio lentus]PML52081.1 excinuclease ABC subunit C [Vibrio lentus]PMN31532.1 excinuclease ABC subunit C [Vibrio lentus]
MKLELVFSDLNDNSKYRFHLAKQAPSGTRPIDVLARSHDEWAGWQVYRGTKKERFVKNKIVSFAQISGSKFLFGGIFNITCRDSKHYEVELDSKYSELIGRLTIDYKGDNTRGTVFKPDYVFSYSEISSISQHPYQGERFVSYDSVNHSFEIMNIVIRNELNDWKVALSSVFGVYLLTDMNTGKHYVGSAYGTKGIWGRWSDYIYGCHGNNKELKELYAINTREYFEKHFKFTILEVLSSSLTPEEVIKRESLWKSKLQTIEFGYNAS